MHGSLVAVSYLILSHLIQSESLGIASEPESVVIYKTPQRESRNDTKNSPIRVLDSNFVSKCVHKWVCHVPRVRFLVEKSVPRLRCWCRSDVAGISESHVELFDHPIV